MGRRSEGDNMMSSLWTTIEVARRLGKTRRQVDYLLERRPDLRPALTLSGYLVWCEDDVLRLSKAFQERTRRTEKKTATE